MSKSSAVTSEKPTKIKQQESLTDKNNKNIVKSIGSIHRKNYPLTPPTLTKEKQVTLKASNSRSNLGIDQSQLASKSGPSSKRHSTTSKKTPASSKVSVTSKQPSSLNYAAKKKKPLPTTPPSNRVSKTNYFPTKNMYSNAIKRSPAKLTNERVSNLNAEIEKDDPNKERPKTATLKKSTILNLNPDTKTELSHSPVGIEQNIYEDDFDSYESDFEEYQTSSNTSSFSSTEVLEDESSSSSSYSITRKVTTSEGTEEKMLDSGNFDMHHTEYRKILGNRNEPVKKETIEMVENNRSNFASLSDEGFEDSKSSLSSNVQCINFVRAQKRIQYSKHLEKQRKRGRDILEMIKLNHCNFTLVEMVPVTYDVFIRSFGNLYSKQISTQTGDDNGSEEVQTELIETTDKWTQYPIKFSKINCDNTNYLQLYKQEYAGVSSNFGDCEIQYTNELSYKFEKQLLHATQLMLNLLYESHSNYDERIVPNSEKVPFSNGYIKFNTESFLFLQSRPITTACYYFPNKLLTVHGKKADGNNFDEDLVNSIVCIWNILNCEEPERILNVPGILNCCLTSETNHLIIGGLEDGALSIWDLRDSNQNMNKVEGIFYEQPNHITGVNAGHTSKIVSIKQLELEESDIFKSKEDVTKIQICSLDEIGTFIVWVIIRKFSSYCPNLLYWNQISIVQNMKICLTHSHPELVNLLCTDMIINYLDTHHILISTNHGQIIHCLSITSKAKPKKYHSRICSQINCLALCPFSSQYFLAGHDDGTITLYSSTLQKSLIAMSNKNEHLHSGVESIQWCYDKPCLFYVKDSSNTIHVWDLKISDLFPLYSVPFKEKITVMKLSKSQLKETDTSYMILATNNGCIHLHTLTKDGDFNKDAYKLDIKNFLNYVNRL